MFGLMSCKDIYSSNVSPYAHTCLPILQLRACAFASQEYCANRKTELFN